LSGKPTQPVPQTATSTQATQTRGCRRQRISRNGFNLNAKAIVIAIAAQIAGSGND
jgi:hypothetical protein